MCFRLCRIRDLMAMKEGRWPQRHGEGGRREELKGAWAWYEEQVPDVLQQVYGWGRLGGGVMMAEGSGTVHACMHARCVAPGRRADGVANERLSRLAGDAVWQIRSIGRIWARWARPARGNYGCRWRGSSGPLPDLRCTSS